jgi:hypothetical protein
LRRRLFAVAAPEKEPSALQKYFHGESANAVKAVIAGYGEVVSFQTIADSIGFSHEFVRQRLKNDPHVFKIGKQYRVPKATAARFVTELLSGNEKAA